jgi:hydrogenase maturation protease
VRQLRELAGAGSRVVLLGVGNTLRADDGFGPALVHRLDAAGTRAVCIDAGTTPENQTAPVARAEPDAVVILDTADSGAEPGSLSLMDAARISGCGCATTHSISLALLADYVRRETGAEVALLAVQPAVISFGAEMGEEVRRALDRAETALLEALEG